MPDLSSAHFSKIRVTDDEVKIQWWTRSGDDKVKHELESSNAPLPELRQALQAFAPFILTLLGLPKKYGEDLDVLSLNGSWHGENQEVLGLTVSCKKTIEGSNSPFVFATPHRREAKDGEEASETALNSKWVELFDEAKAEAIRYINGAREQVDAFDDAA